MAMEQMMAFIQSLPPEEQQAAMQNLQGQLGSQGGQMPPGMPPAPSMGQPVDPRMGLPGKSGMTPGQKMQGYDPNMSRDFTGEGAIISDEQKQAEALRGTKTPQGIYTRNAGFIAANPISHLASGIQKGMGNYQAKKALDKKIALSELVTTTQQKVSDNVYKKETEAARKKEMEEEMRENRRGTPMEQMAANPNISGYS